VLEGDLLWALRGEHNQAERRKFTTTSSDRSVTLQYSAYGHDGTEARRFRNKARARAGSEVEGPREGTRIIARGNEDDRSGT